MQRPLLAHKLIVFTQTRDSCLCDLFHVSVSSTPLDPSDISTTGITVLFTREMHGILLSKIQRLLSNKFRKENPPFGRSSNETSLASEFSWFCVRFLSLSSDCNLIRNGFRSQENKDQILALKKGLGNKRKNRAKHGFFNPRNRINQYGSWRRAASSCGSVTRTTSQSSLCMSDIHLPKQWRFSPPIPDSPIASPPHDEQTSFMALPFSSMSTIFLQVVKDI